MELGNFQGYSPRVVSVMKETVSLSLLSSITSGSGISISRGISLYSSVVKSSGSGCSVGGEEWLEWSGFSSCSG